jgi:SAM-dependent methyltransferase
MVTEYGRVIQNPAGELDRVLDFCGLTADGLRRREAASSVRPDLRHHRLLEGDLPEEVDDVYRRLTEAGEALGSTPEWAPSADPHSEAEVLVVMRTSWRPLFLVRGVRDVLGQTFNAWHLHIVNDGGPPARVEEVVAPFRDALGSRLTVQHLLPGRGMEAASNAAIASGVGRYIVIHDDDDTWHPRYLEETVDFLSRNDSPAVVSKAMIVREETVGDGFIILERVPFGPREKQVTREMLLERNRITTSSLLFRRSVVERIGPYREDMWALGDWEFNLRLAELGPIPFLSGYLANWHRRQPHDPLPNSADEDHRRFLRVIENIRRSAAGEEPLDLPVEMRQLRSSAGVDQVHQAGELVELRPEPFKGVERQPGGWIATRQDPQLDLVWEGGPVRPGLYLLTMDHRWPEETGEAQIFCRRNGPFTEPESIRLRPTADGRVAVLMNSIHGFSALRLDPMDLQGRFTLENPRLARLADPVDRLTSLNRRAGFPDVLCIGAQRAGTTWLWQNLRSHPGVWAPPVKEVHFFDNSQDADRWREFRQRAAFGLIGDIHRAVPVQWAVDFGMSERCDEQWYSRIYDDAPDESVRCDFTPAYSALDKGGVERVAKLVPGARIIFLLRDPVARAISSAVHELLARGETGIDEQAVRRELQTPAVKARSNYRRTLELWESFFPPDHIGIFFFDDLQWDPLETLRGVVDFLGLDHDPVVEAGAGRPCNREADQRLHLDLDAVRAELSTELLPELEWLSERFGAWAVQWLDSARARIRSDRLLRDHADAKPSSSTDNSRSHNLLIWDRLHPWPADGDEWTGQADASGLPYGQWKKGVVEHWIEPYVHDAATVLEIGPGRGRWTGHLADRCERLVLVDVSPNCLERCRDLVAGRTSLRCHLGRGADLPLDLTGEVDFVWSFDAFVHMEPADVRAYLKEIARVLRPGGWSVLHHANRRHWTLWIEKIRYRGPVWRTLYRYLSMGLSEAKDGWRSAVSAVQVSRWAGQAGLVTHGQLQIWKPGGGGVPRHRDRISVLRRPSATGG